MVYEIEKRALFKKKADFDKCQKYVKTHGRLVSKYIFKSFLFKEPVYLRIRIVKGKSYAEITKKYGTYKDAARKEENSKVKLSKIKKYLKEIKKEGFGRCVCFKTISNAYELEGLRVDFNNITYLGRIVEVEALTENKKEISHLNNKVSALMKKLNLHELKPEIYQKMMKNAHVKGTKPISKQNFSI